MSTKRKVDDVIAAYIKLRDTKDRLVEQHKEELRPIHEKLEKLNAWLLKQSQTTGVDSFKTPEGTAYKTTKDSVSVADRNDFFDFCEKHDQMHLISSAASKVAVREYLDEHGELPPGISFTRTYVMNVNRPRKTTRSKDK